MLTLANALWESGHFYSAVLLYLPVQVAYVLAHNFTVLLACVFAGNMERV